MSDWQDQALILSARPHGENAALVEVFSREQGRHNGILRGGMGRRLMPVIQPGNLVQALWRSRIKDDLGTFTLEPIRSRAHAMESREALAGLAALCAMLQVVLPERAPHPRLWQASNDLLDQLLHPDWPSFYLAWELVLLEELGFGLDLTTCAVTGVAGDLRYVSPKTGRAVSQKGAGDWADRLLPLPPLMGDGLVLRANLADAFAVTSHFLRRDALEITGRKDLPEARGRFLDLLARK